MASTGGRHRTPLSAEDQQILADMKQRELQLKRRERAADAIAYQLRRYRVVLTIVASLAFALTVTALVAFVAWLDPAPTRWNLALPSVAFGAFLGVLLGQHLWETKGGRRMLANEERRLRQRFSGDLHAGRRWLPFYYRGEEISAYVPQILYFIESEQRFDSVAEALSFAKENRRDSTTFAARALKMFVAIAAETNLLVLSSTDETGRPSSRVMRFVKTEQPGVWYVTMAPEGPKVHELDLGRIALVTPPTESGATISSNRVEIERAGMPFPAVAALYRDQVPGYVDGMTEEQQERELVYRLVLQSARVDTWLDHEVVEFVRPAQA
jgi:hypothetical protein